MRVSIGANPAEIDCVWNLVGRLADVVLANADRWVLVARTARHVKFIPSDSIVRGHGNTGDPNGRTSAARRVGHIGGALRRYLDVSMNTAEAHRRIVKRNCRGKSLPAIVAARAL